MDEAPLRMECFDVSHLGGTNIVASMVVFEDGLPRKDHYRRFSIPESSDDTESIYQVLSRRLAYLAEPVEASDDATGRPIKRKFSYPPQLLIVDGGQPQVAAAQRALDRGRYHGDSAVRNREAARGDLATRLGLPGDPSSQQRCPLPRAENSGRSSPVRDQLPASETQERHSVCARRDSGARAFPCEGASQALRICCQVEGGQSPRTSGRCAASVRCSPRPSSTACAAQGINQ